MVSKFDDLEPDFLQDDPIVDIDQEQIFGATPPLTQEQKTEAFGPSGRDIITRNIISGMSNMYDFLAPSEEQLERLRAIQAENQKIADRMNMPVRELSAMFGYGDPRGEILEDLGFTRPTLGMNITQGREFLFGAQKKGFNKLKEGADFLDLTGEEQFGIVLSPLDLLDIGGLSFGLKKLAQIGLKELGPKATLADAAKDKQIMKLMSDSEAMDVIQKLKPVIDGEQEFLLRGAKGPKQKKSVAPTLKDAEVVPGIKIKDFDESLLLQTKPLKETEVKKAGPAAGTTFKTLSKARKNMAKRFSELNYDELPLDGPDPILKIINEERKSAGLTTFSPKSETATIIKRVTRNGDFDEQTLKKLNDYREKRRVFINSQKKEAVSTMFEKKRKEKADAALDVINKINENRETPAKFTSETLIQELQKEYPALFVGDFTQKTSRRNLIDTIKKIHPEIADSLVEPGQKVRKGTFDISEGGATQQNIFADLFSTEFKSGQDPVTLLKVDPETRFFNNIRRTSKQSAEDFFETVNLSDIKKGGKYHNDFIRFKEIDKTRLDAVDDLRPLLKKIFSKVLDKPEKSTRASLQIAHRFETKGIKEGYASDKYMKGADPAELYIDVSDYNSVIQPELERRARVFYQKYLDEGLEEDYQEFLEINKDMIALGVEGQIAPGFKIGKAMPIQDKIRQIMDEALDEKIITETEYTEGYKMAEKIGEAREKYKQKFGPAKFSYGGLVEEELDIFQDDLPEGSYEVASLKLPFFKMLGKAPVNEVAPIPTPKEKLANPTKKQKESLETEKAKRAEEDIFDPTPGEAVMPEREVAMTPLTNQPMTSVFYSDIERALTNAPDEFANKQAVLDFLNKNRIKKSEVEDYRIASLLKLFDEDSPIPKQQIISQVRTAPISGMKVHATGKGSDIINQFGDVPTRYTGYAESGFIPDTQRERILYLNRDKLPGDPGQYPQSMFGGENIQRHNFGIPNEDNTYIVGWTRLTDRFGFVPPKVAGPETQVNVKQLNKQIVKNNRSISGLYAEAQNKLIRLAEQRGLNRADIDELEDDLSIGATRDLLSQQNAGAKISALAKYADQLNEVSPGLLDQIDDLIVKNRELYDQVTKASSVDPSGVVRVTFADEIQSDLLQAAAGRKQQLAAALRKIQEEGKEKTNLQGLNKVAQATLDFFEQNKSVFRPLTKTEEEVGVVAERINVLEKEVDEIVDNYIATRETSQADIERLSSLLNDNINTMIDEILSVDSNTMAGLFPDLPFKNRDEWADALIKKDLYELAYRKFVLKEPDASEYYAVSPSKYVSKRYNFEGNAATPQDVRDMDKASRIETFKREGTFVNSRYKGIGMDEFYGGPDSVDQKGKHYTSTIEKILKKQAQSNNSEVIIMPVQVKDGEGSAYFKITDQNDNMVATLTNGDQARELLIANPNYKVETITVPDKKSMEPVFAIKITPEMLEPYKTHKAQGGLVEHIDIFEV